MLGRVIRMIQRSGIFALGVALFGLFSVHAEGWVKRLDCGDSVLVVDSAYSYEKGLTEHQLVIRDPAILQGLMSAVGAPLPLNDRQELVLNLGSRSFQGDFSVLLLDQELNPGVERAYLNGHWVGESRYQIGVTWVNAGPGWGGEPHDRGSWVLNGCHGPGSLSFSRPSAPESPLAPGGVLDLPAEKAGWGNPLVSGGAGPGIALSDSFELHRDTNIFLS